MMQGKPNAGDGGKSARFVVSAAFLFLASLTAQATQQTWQVDTAFSYLSGKYGTDQTTDMLYWPVTVKRFLGWGDVSLTVPYLSVHSSGGQAVINGRVVTNSTGTASGLGDVILKGRYNWIEQHELWPFIDLIGRIKFPTASRSEGLGTGEFDYDVGAEVARTFNGDYMGFADLYYTFIGNPPGVSYHDRVSFDIGAGRQLTAQLMISTFYEIRTAIDPSQTDAHTLNLFANYRLNPNVKVYAILDAGLTSGAEDYGVMGGLSYAF